MSEHHHVFEIAHAFSGTTIMYCKYCAESYRFAVLNPGSVPCWEKVAFISPDGKRIDPPTVGGTETAE